MAIAALALWMLTVAVGVYMLISSTRLKGADTPTAVGASAGPAEMSAGSAGKRKADPFAPPSLRAARSEPIPGLRALGEFTHPALAITGFAFWLLYTMVHDRVLEAIALGILLGAIAAGVSLAVANGRAARKGDGDALVFSGRVLAFHVAGAALTLLLAALIIV